MRNHDKEKKPRVSASRKPEDIRNPPPSFALTRAKSVSFFEQVSDLQVRKSCLDEKKVAWTAQIVHEYARIGSGGARTWRRHCVFIDETGERQGRNRNRKSTQKSVSLYGRVFF